MSSYRELTAEETKILRKHQMWLRVEEGGERANFSGWDFSNTDFQGADLRYADFQGADLQYADLQDANLRGAKLQDADLQDADLRGADLRGAKLQNADLRGAKLQNADLRGAKLQYADLQNVNLDFTSWPLWCGSKEVIADDRLVAQLAFHLTRLDTTQCSDNIKQQIEEIRKMSISNEFCKYRDDVEQI